jgi:hypothetical protein
MDVPPCILVEIHRRFEAPCVLQLQSQRVNQAGDQRHLGHSCVLLGLLLVPEGGGTTLLRNVGELLPEYMTSHLRTHDYMCVSFEVTTIFSLSNINVNHGSCYWDAIGACDVGAESCR